MHGFSTKCLVFEVVALQPSSYTQHASSVNMGPPIFIHTTWSLSVKHGIKVSSYYHVVSPHHQLWQKCRNFFSFLSLYMSRIFPISPSVVSTFSFHVIFTSYFILFKHRTDWYRKGRKVLGNLVGACAHRSNPLCGEHSDSLLTLHQSRSLSWPEWEEAQSCDRSKSSTDIMSALFCDVHIPAYRYQTK